MSKTSTYTFEELNDLYDLAFTQLGELGDGIDQDLRHFLSALYPQDVIEKHPDPITYVLDLFKELQENAGQPILRVHKVGEMVRLNIGVIEVVELDFRVDENVYSMPYGRVSLPLATQVATAVDPSCNPVDQVVPFTASFGGYINLSEETYLPVEDGRFGLVSEQYELHIGHDAINEFVSMNPEYAEVISSLRGMLRGQTIDVDPAITAKAPELNR